MPDRLPILQFGTSRFLQAHADLFISEANSPWLPSRVQLNCSES